MMSPTDMSLVSALARRAQDRPDEPVIRDDADQVLDAGTVWRLATALATSLREQGTRPGDRVCWSGRNDPGFLITLLATQSPVSTDLRLISALLHVLKNVERMGDQCVNICKVIPLTGNEPPADSDMVELILTMGKQTRSLVTQAKRAFGDRDVEMARDLVRQDDTVDDLNRECFRLALEIGDDADKREWAMTMLLAARAIERIGDNAVDIGEQVAFVVTGLFREFEDASHPG